MVCRVCLLDVKKSAVLCETCTLISHSKCAVNAPPTCDLRAQLLLYAQYAEERNLGITYSNTMEILKEDGGHVLTSPVSEVAHTAPSSSLNMTNDYPPTQGQSLQGVYDRPSSAFKFIAAFKTKRPRTSLSPELGQGSSSALLLPSNAPIDAQNQRDFHQLKDNTIPKKPSLLKRNRDLRRQRPQSQSSDSTSPNTTSTRSAGSLSTHLEHGWKFPADTDTGTQVKFPAGGEFGADTPSKTTWVSEVSTVSQGDLNLPPTIPGSMHEDNPRHGRQESKASSDNCSIQ